jgi:hypothetical protein
MNYTPEEIISFFLLHSDRLTQEQANAFSAWIKASPENSRLFIQASLLHRGIHDYFCSTDATCRQLIESGLSDASDSKVPFEGRVWAELSREEKNAPAIKIHKTEAASPEKVTFNAVNSTPRVSPKGYLWFSMVSIAASLLLVLYVWMNPRHIPQDVATVTDVFQAKWDQPQNTLQKGVRLFDNRKPLGLLGGVIKMQFDNGVQVVIEGPAVFSVDAYERVRLTSGKLYAKVPRQAIGFRVNTPNCSVIDMGTEFGMDVNTRGETSVHLMKGKASLVTSSQQRLQQSQILQENQAASVTYAGVIEPVAFQDCRFVRDFDSESRILWNGENLDLAAIAAGGSGLKRIVNRGIDPLTGTLAEGNIETRDQGATTDYIMASAIPYVDGVFVPDGGEGPVQMTSAGHTFDGFGDTTGQYFMNIGSYSDVYMVKFTGNTYTSLHLPGFSDENAVNLCLHANAGITFDLQKIRTSMPFAAIKGFSSFFGVSSTLENDDIVSSDFYVFVDGHPRMVEKNVSNTDQPRQITIPLTHLDRFLTLVCTEGDLNYGDWSVFVNPVLELELAD